MHSAGLIGNVQFHSGMSAMEMFMAICFHKTYGSENPLKCQGEYIICFDYLQRTGAGSRSLC